MTFDPIKELKQFTPEEIQKRVKEVIVSIPTKHMRRSGFYPMIPTCPECHHVIHYGTTIDRSRLRGDCKGESGEAGCDFYIQFPPQSHFKICPHCFGGTLAHWFAPGKCPVCHNRKFNVRH